METFKYNNKQILFKFSFQNDQIVLLYSILIQNYHYYFNLLNIKFKLLLQSI